MRAICRDQKVKVRFSADSSDRVSLTIFSAMFL